MHLRSPLSATNMYTKPLTRKDLYELAEYCRECATELARHEQSRVSLKHCNEFNKWLPVLKSYDQLANDLSGLKPAWPVARWQIMILATILGFGGYLALPRETFSPILRMWVVGYPFVLLIIYFLPERLYGTTIELVEAKVLYVVEKLERLLRSEDMGLSEAAYHRIKENLDSARTDLREQIDLAYRARQRTGLL